MNGKKLREKTAEQVTLAQVYHLYHTRAVTRCSFINRIIGINVTIAAFVSVINIAVEPQGTAAFWAANITFFFTLMYAVQPFGRNALDHVQRKTQWRLHLSNVEALARKLDKQADTFGDVPHADAEHEDDYRRLVTHGDHLACVYMPNFSQLARCRRDIEH